MKIRFMQVWVNTSLGYSKTCEIFSHELVEAITDPFNNGWEQSFPQSSSGQIADLCSQPAMSDWANSIADWSEGDKACIVSTPGTRRGALQASLDGHALDKTFN